MPIRKAPGGFKIDNTKGTSPTREAALRRLRAIKANQRKSGKMSGNKRTQS